MSNTFVEIESLVKRALELDQQAEVARQSRDEALAGRVYEELLGVLIPKAEALLALNNGHNAFAHFAFGVILRVLHVYEDAISQFKLSLAIAPNVINTLLEITQCLAQSGDLVNALVFARRAVVVAPYSAEAWGNLAMVLIENKEREEAFDAISRAIELDPNDKKNLYILENFHRYFQ